MPTRFASTHASLPTAWPAPSISASIPANRKYPPHPP